MSHISNGPGLSYADAGVDIDAGNALIEKIKPSVARTHRAGVLGGLGGFGGLFEIPVERFERPVMVSGADGVGTKLQLAKRLGIHTSIGIDLVAMCVNDIVVCGAEPLWFLDYYGTGKLQVDTAADVVSGIADGCVLAGCALLGGETAEMPGMYDDDDYDLAGFAVGIVEKSALIDASSVTAGDVIVGLASSGPHSNGFSLINKIAAEADLHQAIGDTSLGQALLEPTRIYVKAVQAAIHSHPIKSIAHITGGGLSENLPRVLPANTSASINIGSWAMPAVFNWIQRNGNVADAEMRRTFNLGIGMTLIVDKTEAQPLIDTLQALGETAMTIGEVIESAGTSTVDYSR